MDYRSVTLNTMRRKSKLPLSIQKIHKKERILALKHPTKTHTNPSFRTRGSQHDVHTGLCKPYEYLVGVRGALSSIIGRAVYSISISLFVFFRK